jgi:hypothetical protein
MKKAFFLFMLLICSYVVCLAASINMDGAWYGTLKVEDSQYPLQYNFKVEGDKLTGTAKGPTGDLQITDGEVHGNDFTFAVSLQKLYLVHSGKIYPDSISLNIESGDSKAHVTLMRTGSK